MCLNLSDMSLMCPVIHAWLRIKHEQDAAFDAAPGGTSLPAVMVRIRKRLVKGGLGRGPEKTPLSASKEASTSQKRKVVR